jgi:hypothetical protein
MKRRCQRTSGMAVLAAVTAIGLAACGGSADTPHVARLNSSSSGSTTAGTSAGNAAATLAKGDPAQLLNDWTACMRSHGDPNQADPTIDGNRAIHIAQPAGYFGTMVGPSGQSDSGAGVICQRYLTAASTALNGGQPLPEPNLAAADKHAECMRAHGVPGFPDPGSNVSGPGSPASSGSNGPPNPDSPAFQKASKLCTGGGFPAPGALHPGDIELTLPNGQLGMIGF